MSSPQLLWDWGTAYDLFVSLAVLHRPGDFGVRGAWAAGVRARLPNAEREMLEQAETLHSMLPFHWVYALPEPKDGSTALWVLNQTPAAERLEALTLSAETAPEIKKTLRDVAARGAWDESDREALRAAYVQEKGKEYRKLAQRVTTTLDWWSRPEEFGDRYLAALQAYQESFFAEEEKRIQPVLQRALAQAQEKAQQLALPDLLEELSQGLRFVELSGLTELVLVPSYWGSPFVFFGHLSAGREIWAFGARPAEASLVPGETVPDALVRTLKALSDPTRLRILRYLAEKPLTPAELTRRLRLRAPTVTHHLKVLRMAGLVQVILDHNKGKGKGSYAARSGAVAAAFDSLKGFIEQNELE